MSRNSYDSTSGVLTPIGGWQSVDAALSPTSLNPVRNSVVTGTTGIPANLTTDSKTNLVSAINEVDSHADANATGVTKTRQMIAPIENGPNYSKSYSKGAQFIYNGILYVVTASSVGTTTAINIGSGGNATAANPLVSQISDLKNNLLATAYYSVDSVTVPGNHLTADVEFNVSKSGYRILGVVGWVINTGYTVSVVSCYTWNLSTVKLRLINHGPNTVTTGEVYIYCLYLKN